MTGDDKDILSYYCVRYWHTKGLWIIRLLHGKDMAGMRDILTHA